jgi:hypothetical protein
MLAIRSLIIQARDMHLHVLNDALRSPRESCGAQPCRPYSEVLSDELARKQDKATWISVGKYAYCNCDEKREDRR